MLWDKLGRPNLEPMTALFANLIYLADRVDVQIAACPVNDSLLMSMAPIRDLVTRHRGTNFAPELVEAFLEASVPEAFWLALSPDYVAEHVTEMHHSGNSRTVTHADLKRFALIIADIVDAKSHFTKEHSIGVSQLSRYLGGLAGFSGERLGEIEIAGLLHDIGKLQVPDEVLDSPAALSMAERAVIMKHSFATWRILRRIGGLGDVARWASEHHESVGGQGYPFHFAGREIPIESRIIKVADVYQALAQTRPYRRAAPPGEILRMLREMQARNEVDAGIVDQVAGNLEACQKYAVGGETEATAGYPRLSGIS